MTHEVKVGSLWLDSAGNVLKILHIFGETAFIQENKKTYGMTVSLNYFDKCTPSTPPRRCEGWVNVYQHSKGLDFGGEVYVHETIAMSNAAPRRDYLTTIKIEYEEPQNDTNGT